MSDDHSFTYRDAGVNVAAGNEAVRLLQQRLKSTQHPLVIEGIGGFGGVMGMPPLTDPVLVAGTDGVGTKVMVAQEYGRYSTIGIDLVAMSVNDISACGATPLFFLDYLVTGQVEPERVAELVGGVDEGCLRAGCVLLGGETAEHPGHFKNAADFDMAGFAVGVVERGELWGPNRVVAGDLLLGLESSGLHSNGFSLVRVLLREHGIDPHSKFLTQGGAFCTIAGPNASVGDVILTPTTIYSPVLRDLGHACAVHAAAHITGGGFPDNVGRALPSNLAAEIDLASWRPPAVFTWLHGLGVAHDDLLTTFNCGLGMVLVLPADELGRAQDVIARVGLRAHVVGTVTARNGGGPVRYTGKLAL
ncbi:MAG: phosphoribosylformylglycinamidine cyclo-ligase [Thermoleophilia bacterium]